MLGWLFRLGGAARFGKNADVGRPQYANVVRIIRHDVPATE